MTPFYIIAVSAFLLPLIVKLEDNFKKWKKEEPVNHKKEMYYYIAAEVPAAVLFCVISNNWWSLAVVPFMLGVWFNFLFDGMYNLLRRWYNKKFNRAYKYITWWYLGTNDKDDAATDNFYQSIPLWLHKTIKIGGILITTGLYILICLKNN